MERLTDRPEITKDTDMKEQPGYSLIYKRLAEYEIAEEQGRLVELPCKAGDKMFSFLWNIKNEKYEVHTSEIKNVRYDSADGCVMVSDGERYHVWGKTVFPTAEATEAALIKKP